jgi:hypothetical protein
MSLEEWRVERREWKERGERDGWTVTLCAALAPASFWILVVTLAAAARAATAAIVCQHRPLSLSLPLSRCHGTVATFAGAPGLQNGGDDESGG